jgi:hypothetical protein
MFIGVGPLYMVMNESRRFSLDMNVIVGRGSADFPKIYVPSQISRLQKADMRFHPEDPKLLTL